MNLLDLSLHIPNFVPEEICDDIIQFYEDAPEERKVYERSYDENHDKNVTKSGLCLTVGNQEPVFSKIHEYTGLGLVEWLQHIHSFGCFEPSSLQSLCSRSHAYRIIKYFDGLYIHDHTDVGTNNLTGMTIRGSCTLNLSSVDDYEGGEFTIFKGKHQIKLGKGDLMVFPADSFWVHGTNPVTNGVRYTINSFLHPDLKDYD